LAFGAPAWRWRGACPARRDPARPGPRGIGYTFVEGALEAWLSDELGEERFGPALLRGGQVGRVAGFFGIGGSVALASVGLGLPLLVAGVAFVLLAGVLVVVMREPGFQRPPRTAASGALGRTRAAMGAMAERAGPGWPRSAAGRWRGQS
jgi:DHA3 family tetracycline resistance protein-like MFS transporter